jgi:hypothetical protein
VSRRGRWGAIAWRTVFIAAAGTAVVVAAGLLFLVLVPGRVPKETLWRSRLALLLGLEAVYGAVLAAALVATPALGLLLIAARRRRAPCTKLARWFLLGSALLVGFVAAEAGASAWRARLERAGVLAIAGRGGASNRTRPAATLFQEQRGKAEIALPTRFPAAADDAFTLVVLGESSAQGVPFNLYALSVGSLVRWQLEEVLPGRTFQLGNLAASGGTLGRQEL